MIGYLMPPRVEHFGAIPEAEWPRLLAHENAFHNRQATKEERVALADELIQRYEPTAHDLNVVFLPHYGLPKTQIVEAGFRRYLDAEVSQ